MQLPQDLLAFLNSQQPAAPEEKAGMAQQILSARFKPTFEDVANSTFQGALNDEYINPQGYADTRLKDAMGRIASVEKMNRERQQVQLNAQRFGLDERRLGLSERQFDETARHNRVSEGRIGQITPYQQEYLDIQRQRNNLQQNQNSGNGKPPSGYRWTQTGDLEPIPGGPGTTISAELSARLGLAQKFLGESEGLKTQVGQGVATGPIDYIQGALGYGESGQVQRRIADGADALQRMLTGAGMPQSEATDYSNRFRATFRDNDATLTDKLTNLENVLKAQMAMATRGKGGMPAQPEAGSQDEMDPRIQAARQAGYSDEEIQQYLMGGQ